MVKNRGVRKTGDQPPIPAKVEFSRIYFDTSVLRSQRWPEVSASLKGLLTLAHSVEIPCLVPQPVAIELEEWWLHEFFDRFTVFITHAGGTYPGISIPKYEEARAEYRLRAEAAMRDNLLGACPFLDLSLESIFRAAAAHTAPFERDYDFRDGVIQMSILQDIAAHPGSVAAILSEDVGFREQCWKLANREAANFEIYSDLQSLRKAAETRVTDVTARKIEADKTQLRAAIEDANTWAKIREWIQAKLKLKVEPNVRAIKGLADMKLISVETPFPPERAENQVIDVSFDVGVSVLLTALRPVSRPQPEESAQRESVLAIGERNKVEADRTSGLKGYLIFNAFDSELAEVDEIQTINVRVQGQARYSAGAYRDIVPVKFEQIPETTAVDLTQPGMHRFFSTSTIRSA